MITLTLPNNNTHERKYITQTLLSDFLGLELDLIFADVQNYTLRFQNRSIEIQDAFFNLFPKPLSYLCNEAIPSNIQWTQELPIIYGDDRLLHSQDALFCGLDIFGSAFFMLSRFEELIIEERDTYHRFKDSNALAIKHNFEKIPVVNAYCEYLWELLLKLGYTHPRKLYTKKLTLTHDVDHLRFYTSFNVFFERFKKCIFKYNNYPQALKESYNYLCVFLKIKKDPYDTFDEMIHIAKTLNTPSHFMFITSYRCKYDQDYSITDTKVRKLINKLSQQKQKIGIHPGFDTYNNYENLSDDIKQLRKIHNDIHFSRQHYLKYDVSITPTLLNRVNIDWDSSLGYSETIGFRCGCCYPYYMFDIKKRETLNIQQKPLLIMDVALKKLSQLRGFEHAKQSFKTVIQNVNHYNGEAVILWHNSSFKLDDWPAYAQLYFDLISTNRPYSSE